MPNYCYYKLLLLQLPTYLLPSSSRPFGIKQGKSTHAASSFVFRNIHRFGRSILPAVVSKYVRTYTICSTYATYLFLHASLPISICYVHLTGSPVASCCRPQEKQQQQQQQQQQPLLLLLLLLLLGLLNCFLLILCSTNTNTTTHTIKSSSYNYTYSMCVCS